MATLKKASGGDHLYVRGTTYYFMMRVPRDLESEYPGQQQIKESLKTSDLRRAIALHNETAGQIASRVLAARERAERAARPQIYDQIDERLARVLIERAWICWEHLRMADEHSIEAFPDFAMGVLAKLPGNGHLLPANALRRWYANIEKERSISEFTRYAEIVIRREIPVILPDLITPEVSDLPQHTYFRAPVDKPKMLKELIERFEGDVNRQDLADTTKGNHAPAFNALMDILGPEKNIRHITREDILRVRDVLMWMPVGASKIPAFDGMSYIDIVAATKAMKEKAHEKLDLMGVEDGEATPEQLVAAGMPKFLKRSSLNKYLGGIQQLFDFAVAERMIDATPASSLKLNNVGKSTKREFTPEELQQLFCRNYEFTDISWIPVLLLYQGLRPNEGCQLQTDNVIKSSRSDLWCLDITVEGRVDPRLLRNGGNGQGAGTLKTPQSKRKIPIHRRLIDLGFLDYVEQRRAAGEKMLFGVRKWKGVSYYESVRKETTKILVDAGVYTPDTTLHSLRHTFAEFMRNMAEAPKEMREAIGGWSVSGSAEIDYGSEKFWPERMQPWLDRMDWPDLFTKARQQAEEAA